MSNHEAQPNIKGTASCSTPVQLAEVYELWLQSEWPDRPGQCNSERQPSALSNYRRSLRAISLACGYEGDLKKTPATLLSNDGSRIGDYVAKGLNLEANHKGKSAPRMQLVRNMQSNARAISKFFMADVSNNIQSGYQKWLQRPIRKIRERMPYVSWPLSLRLEFEKFQKWLGATLSQIESEYRPERLADISIKGEKARLGQYIKWRLENNLPTNHLHDLINEDEFAQYLDDYIDGNEHNSKSIGGHTSAKLTSISLASIIRYLVATEQFNPTTNEPTPELYKIKIRRTPLERRQRLEDCNLLKKVFYRLGRDAFRKGGKRGDLIRNSKVRTWTPIDMRNLRDQGFNTLPRKMDNKTPSRVERFTRKRSATIFGISAETPMRVLTLSLITWSDMTRLSDGRWEILVPAEKLKIKMIEEKVNSYHVTYSLTASRYIDEYRNVLVENFGEEFEREVPSIFPVMHPFNGRGRRANASTLARGVIQLALELRDTRFNPHSARHTVATYAINQLGAPGIAVAAKLLGDKPETVLKFYLNGLSSDAKEIGQYFALLEG